MEIKQLDELLEEHLMKKDSVYIPDCFGDFNKKNKLCSTYCSLSIKCCVLHQKNPRIGLLERLLNTNQYAVKLN